MAKAKPLTIKMTNPLCDWLLNNDDYLDEAQISMIKDWRDHSSHNPTLKQLQKISYQSGLPFYDMFNNQIPKRPYKCPYLSKQFMQNCSWELYHTLLFTNYQFNWIQNENRLWKIQLRSGVKPYSKNNPHLATASSSEIADYIIQHFHLQTKATNFEALREKLSDGMVCSFIEKHMPDRNYDNRNMTLDPNEFKGFCTQGGYYASIIILNGNCSLKTQIKTLLELTILLGMNKPMLINNETKLPKIDQAVRMILKRIHYNMNTKPLTRIDFNFAMLICKQVTFFGDPTGVSTTSEIKAGNLTDYDFTGQHSLNKFFKHMNSIRVQAGLNSEV